MQTALGLWIAIAVFVLVSAAGAGQQLTSNQSHPLPMPQERVADSYQIYSDLLAGAQTEWQRAHRSFWLMEDTTTAEPLDSPCSISGMMNPHKAIEAPEARQSDFAEVLADFDAHCHDRYLLDGTQVHVDPPIRLLDEAARNRFRASSGLEFTLHAKNTVQAPPAPDEFRGVGGMYSFTAVYFNRAHTLAMTFIGDYHRFGGYGGSSSWVMLERNDGHWRSLPWVRMTEVSAVHPYRQDSDPVPAV